MTQRLPPHDLEAERAVISASVLSAEALDDAKSILSDPEDFFDRGHRVIWRTVLELDDEGAAIDIVTVARRLKDRGDIDKCGGTPGLAAVVNETPAIAHVGEHARIVADLALQRRVIDHLTRFQIEGYQGQPDPSKWAQNVAEGLQDAIEDRSTADAPSLSEILRDLVADAAARQAGSASEAATPTGWSVLDKQLAGGLYRGNLYIVAARPGMGKSAKGLQICDNVAKRGKAAVFCGLEMPVDQVAARLLSIRSGIPAMKIRGARLDENDFLALTQAATIASRLPLGIEDCAGMTVGGIRTAVRRRLRKLRRQFGDHLELGVVVVDYLQLVAPPRMPGRNRENEVAAISSGFRQLAKQLNCPVLVLCQLSRECEKRTNKRPQLSDLRESGAIEQDAYAVTFLYRDSYYWDEEKKGKSAGKEDVCEVIVAKHRNGQTGTVMLGWEGPTTSFYELREERDHEYAAISDGPANPDMPPFEEMT